MLGDARPRPVALGLLGFLGFLIACNGAVASDSVSAPAGAPAEGLAPPDASPPSSSPAEDPTECVETTTVGAKGAPSRVRLRLDIDAREISMLRDDGSRFLGWHYDDKKLLVAYAGFRQPQGGGQWDEFQHDRKYDAQGNETDFRASYPATANLDLPSSAPATTLEHYDNVYDPTGALLSSTLTASGLNGAAADPTHFLFHENAAQQCDRIETDGRVASVETRTYDAQGRLSRVDRTGNNIVINCSSSTWTTIRTYDDRGRTTQLREWCDGAAPTSEPGRVTTTTYRADGTERVEVIDRITDLPSEYPQVTERSAYCAVIDAWRGGSPRDTHPAGTRCML